MSMTEWAKNEIEIACKRENPNREEGEWDYGCACYESALKAYLSLMDDEHSGFSWGLTTSILKRLMDGLPLTPIEDTEDVWSDIIDRRDDKITYQCKRKSSLFKDVYEDGHVEYHDIDQSICIDINTGSSYSNGLVSRIIREKYPITLPYMPKNNPIKVYCEDILTDTKNGDFDTVIIHYCITPEGIREDINRYFKESENGWEEINFEEYQERKVLAEKLKQKQSEEDEQNERLPFQRT